MNKKYIELRMIFQRQKKEFGVDDCNELIEKIKSTYKEVVMTKDKKDLANLLLDVEDHIDSLNDIRIMKYKVVDEAKTKRDNRIKLEQDGFTLEVGDVKGFRDLLKQVNRMLLIKTYRAVGYNKLRAAEVLGVSVKTIYDRIRELQKAGYEVQ